MKRKTKVIIIGTGSAGLSALSEVKKSTDDFLLIQSGPFGTTCARTACMPTKTIIEVARIYNRRKAMAARGIEGAEHLRLNLLDAMNYVRELRDSFAGGMVRSTEKYSSRIIREKAVFLEPTVVKAGDTEVEGESVIIATGSRPIIPEEWEQFSDQILTTEEMVEQRSYPERMAVIGLGPAGLEYAQTLARFGIEIAGFDATSLIAGITDPKVNESMVEILRQEFPLILNEKVKISRQGEELLIQAGEEKRTVQKVLVAIGRRPNLDGLGLDRLGIRTDRLGVPDFDRQSMQVENLPIYIAGDANGFAPILHEAVDEGHIAGYNAIHPGAHCFGRRVPLLITFTEPNIAAVGKTYQEAKDENLVIGEYDFSNQSRARMSATNQGLLRLYVDQEKGLLLGAELAAPAGEHLAHLLAMAIHQKMTVFDLLQLPYYHPTLEEGLQNALKDANRKTSCTHEDIDLLLCRSTPPESLC
jgi:dihydrolipoamide dehydrogenase